MWYRRTFKETELQLYFRILKVLSKDSFAKSENLTPMLYEYFYYRNFYHMVTVQEQIDIASLFLNKMVRAGHIEYNKLDEYTFKLHGQVARAFPLMASITANGLLFLEERNKRKLERVNIWAQIAFTAATLLFIGMTFLYTKWTYDRDTSRKMNQTKQIGGNIGGKAADKPDTTKSQDNEIYTGGTCIVIARGKDGICAAADSRRVVHLSLKGEKFSVLRYDTVCKIHQVGNLFFAASGINVDAVYSIAEKCMQENNSILKAAMCFKVKCDAYQTSILENIRVNKPKDFNKLYEELDNLGCCFFGIENGKPKMVEISFGIISKRGEKIKLRDSLEYYLETSSKYEFVMMGHTDSIYKVVKDTKFWKGKNVQQGLKELISIECDRDSIAVARPITVLSILVGNKFYWSKDSPCTFK